MNQQLSQGYLDPSSRKRPSPALTSDDGSDETSDLGQRPERNKFPKLIHDGSLKAPVNLQVKSHYGISSGSQSLSDRGDSQGSSPNPVPETNKDDLPCSSDAMIDGSQETTEPTCCFGMVIEESPNIRLDVLGDFVDLRIDVSLQPSGQSVTVRNHDSMAYGGLLRQSLAQTIIELIVQYHVSFLAFVMKAVKGEDIAKSPRPYRLCINIYGPKDASRSVGDVLDHAGIYLQHPLSSDLTGPYINPHYLVRPGASHPTHSIEQQLSVPARPSLTLSSDERLKSNVLQAMDDSAQGPSEYSYIASSTWIRTPLKSHQLMALSMMVEKESGRIEGNEFGTLWQRILHRGGGVRYVNSVTRSMQSAPPQICLGGLLADVGVLLCSGESEFCASLNLYMLTLMEDMGLGKTLTMLALIVNRLEASSQIREQGPEYSRILPTLIVTPLSRKHIYPQKVNVCIYHGPSRTKSAADLMAFDIVLTTYDTVAANATKVKRNSAGESQSLHTCEWHRVVLDEAHVIRNAASKRHHAIFTLKAKHRWCLTGSPVFNRVHDLHALLKFLKAYPFDNTSYFNSHITNLLKTSEKKALENLKTLFNCVALRRTKSAVTDQLQLTPRIDRIQEVKFSSEERSLYETIRKSLSYFFHSSEADAGKAGSSGNMLQTITRLRRFCNHGLDLLPPEIRKVLERSVNEKEIAQVLMTTRAQLRLHPFSADIAFALGVCQNSKQRVNIVCCALDWKSQDFRRTMPRVASRKSRTAIIDLPQK
ncbi:MAG: hypothetical protein Q9195_007235 [Heterodermia aff. obscurata]